MWKWWNGWKIIWAKRKSRFFWWRTTDIFWIRCVISFGKWKTKISTFTTVLMRLISKIKWFGKIIWMQRLTRPTISTEKNWNGCDANRKREQRNPNPESMRFTKPKKLLKPIQEKKVWNWISKWNVSAIKFWNWKTSIKNSGIMFCWKTFLILSNEEKKSGLWGKTVPENRHCWISSKVLSLKILARLKPEKP